MTRPTLDGEIGELVARLRRTRPDEPLSDVPELLVNPDGPEAADRLETQAADIARLRELLLQARHHVVFTMDVDPNAADLANAIDAALATRTDVQ